MRPSHRVVAASAVIATLALAGCGSDKKSSDTTTAPAATPTTAVATTAAATTTAPAATTSSADDDGGYKTGGDDDTATSTAAAGVTLEIKQFQFAAVTAKAGEPITIKNADSAPHTVTDQGGTFDVRVEGGTTGTLTVDTPGTYTIICKVHPKMKGTLTIT